MLYRMAYPENDECFKQYHNDLTKLYWPKDRYLADDNIGPLPEAYGADDSNEDRINAVKEALKKIAKSVGEGDLYPVYTPDSTVAEFSPFPFLARFHEYFFQRQWDQPFDNPRNNAYEYFHLHPPKDRDKNDQHCTDGDNYSKNVGDYHHFVNVVAALARLIMYFKDPRHVMDLFEFKHKAHIATEEELEVICRTVAYDSEPGMRTFNLMLAGFYHDIGKTITGPRHGMEGYTILAFHTSRARYQINQIVKKYNKNYEFLRDDLLNVANMVFFHDQFGTIGTGEDSYMRLEDVISAIDGYSLKHGDEHVAWAQRYLFDLWLLNVADIIVSLEAKWELQTFWQDRLISEQKIQQFFRGDASNPHNSGGNLAYDISVVFDIMQGHCHEENTDDTSALQESLHCCSRRHVVERVRRLIRASLRNPLDQRIAEGEKLSSQKKSYMQEVASCIQQIPDHEWDSSIIRSIHSIGDFQEFCRRISWIGKMDYALGFFEKIAQRALVLINKEITQNGTRTGWIRDPGSSLNSGSDEISGSDEMRYRHKVQAQFIADNYAATVVQILSYLVFREESIDSLRNIEFSDTKARLTDEKIDKIIGIEGPFRARRATQLVLQTVYIY